MDNQDNSSNNGGILGKFRQRLYNIKMSRNKKNSKNDKFVENKVAEIRKAIRTDINTDTSVIRRVRSSNVIDKNVNKNDKLKKNGFVSDVIVNIRNTSSDRNYTRKKVGNECEFETLKKEFVEKDNVSNTNKGYIRNNNTSSVNNVQIKNDLDVDKEKLLKGLGIEIINKIKNSFENNLDELEVLMSELYFLEKNQENELELSKVKDLKNKINEMIKQINEIIDQYNLYKSNYYIDNVIGISDNILVDDIIKYRGLLDSFNDEKKFVKEYKALEEFSKLYSNLKVIKNDTERILQSNEEKIEEFDIRDKKYDNIKLEMVNIQELDKKCSLEIKKQNEYFLDLMTKINKINTTEYTRTRMVGVGELVSQSFRYLGLLVLSPLKGLIPGIAVETLYTKMMIKNLYNNIHYKEEKHVKYDTINYDSELNNHLCSIDYTSNLLSDTLDDVKRLKEEFMLQYDSRISGYEDTLKNIQNIENMILHNQNKVYIIKNNLKKSKKINEDKMILVRKMNNN